MKTENYDVAITGNSMIVELTQILLAAGSKPNGLVALCGIDGPGLPEPLDYLMSIVNIQFIFCQSWKEDSHAYSYLLIAELFEVLLSYGARPRMCWTTENFNYFFFKASHISGWYSKKASAPGFSASYDFALDSLNFVLDSLGNLFRCAWLAETGIKDANVLGVEHTDQDDFTDQFIKVSSFSPPCGKAKTLCGRTTKLTQHILNTLSPTQLRILKNILLQRLKSDEQLSKVEQVTEEGLMSDDESMSEEELMSNEQLANTKNALEWICLVETPFNLQHLARHAIIRAMGGRILANASTLNLPKIMQRYVLLAID